MNDGMNDRASVIRKHHNLADPRGTTKPKALPVALAIYDNRAFHRHIRTLQFFRGVALAKPKPDASPSVV